MDNYKEIAEYNRKNYIMELELLLILIRTNKRNLKTATKYERIMECLEKRKPFSRLRLKLFWKFSYDPYSDGIISVEECVWQYENLKKKYADFLDVKYWNINDILYIKSLLECRRAYTLKQAVFLFEYKKRKWQRKK